MSTNPKCLPDTVIDLLRQYYRFDEVIDLYDYAYNLGSLITKLRSLKKSCFESNDRIIFFDREPGMFIRNKDQILWYNMQKILSDLDIPNRFCIIITQHDSREYFNEIYKDMTTDDQPITVFDYWHFTDWMPLPTQNINLNFDRIEKNFITLNRIRKKHRTLVISYLEEFNILDKGFVSYNSIRAGDVKSESYPKDNNNDDSACCYQYLATVPYTSLNEDWRTRDKTTIQLLNKITDRGTDWVYKNFSEKTEDAENYQHNTSANTNLFQQAFLWVVTESDAYTPISFLSEKSPKSIYSKRPFVVISGPGTLKRMQSFGFKTFSEFWDESYDSEPSLEERIKMVMNIVHKIALLNRQELIDLAEKMAPILEHNFQHLQKFNAYQLNNLKKQIIQNLK